MACQLPVSRSRSMIDRRLDDRSFRLTPTRRVKAPLRALHKCSFLPRLEHRSVGSKSTGAAAADIAPAICSIHCSPPRSGADRQPIRVLHKATPKAVIPRGVAVSMQGHSCSRRHEDRNHKSRGRSDTYTVHSQTWPQRQVPTWRSTTCHSSSGNGTIHSLCFLASIGGGRRLSHPQTAADR